MAAHPEWAARPGHLIGLRVNPQVRYMSITFLFRCVLQMCMHTLSRRPAPASLSAGASTLRRDNWDI